MRRRGGFLSRFNRLTYRVGVAGALWLAPCAMNMTRSQVAIVRDAALTVLVTAVASWVARQGQRRADRPN